jgi:bifunctional DNase/RNase
VSSDVFLEVSGVRVEMPTNTPIVLLRERDGSRYLPIWIGAAEATAIAYAQQGVVPPRPLTHDLLRLVIGELGHTLTRVRIVALHDGVFHAALDIDGGAEAGGFTVESRSSDALALALRMDAPVVAPRTLLDEAGVEIGDEDSPNAEDEVERFKEFLDQVSPEDFETGGEPPAQ